MVAKTHTYKPQHKKTKERENKILTNKSKVKGEEIPKKNTQEEKEENDKEK